jgi:8-oxo-dGTP pyrophosphatase MutT (NUDIX family)
VTNGTRRPLEVAVVVWRPGPEGPKFLVLLRSPERQGYWHLVAGGVGWGEDPAGAAKRELVEETGLDADVVTLGIERSYLLDDEPPEVRARFAPDVTAVELVLFRAEAPWGWEPALDEEHVEYRWCDADGAVRLLRYPEPQEAVRAAAESLGERA